MGLQIEPVVTTPADSELVRYPADQIWLRLVGHGDIQVAEYRSIDREGPPPHRHPWDEVQIVADGEVEFSLDGGGWMGGGPGTVQLLPRGVSHTLRVPAGEARLFQVSIGPPYDGFARDMETLFAAGAPLDDIVEVAGRHGVTLG